MTPAELAAWEADEAACAADQDDDVARLRSDHAAYPESPTLNRLALSDRDGRVVGCTLSTDLLASAWAHGAPAALVVEAERTTAVIGPRGSVGYHHRAVRLAHRVHRLNAALRRYSGATRTLPTVTVVAARLATIAADVAAPTILTGSSLRLVEADDAGPPFPALAAVPDHRGPPRPVARLPLNCCALADAARPTERYAVSRAA